MSIALDEPLARPAPRSVSPQQALTTQIVSPELWDRTIAQFDEVCQEQLYTFAKTRWPSVEHEPVLFWRGGEVVGPHLGLLGWYFPGYSVTFGGSLIGAVYAFVLGYGLGRAIAMIYNSLAGRLR